MSKVTSFDLSNDDYLEFCNGVIDFAAHSNYTDYSGGNELSKEQTKELYLFMKNYYECEQ